LGRLETARTLIRECRTLLDSIESAGQDTRSERAYLHLVLGLLVEPDTEESRRHFEQSVALYRKSEDQWLLANVLLNLGVVHSLEGADDKARTILDECLRLFRTMGYHLGVVRTSNALGRLARTARDYEDAQQKHEQSLALARAQGDTRAIAESLDHLAWLALFLGNFQSAAAYLREAAEEYREAGLRPDLANALVQIGVAHWFSGEFERAYAGIAEAASIARAAESRWYILQSAVYRAWLDAVAGRYDQARAGVQEQLGLSQDAIFFGYRAMIAHGASGWAALAQGDYLGARRVARGAVTILQETHIAESLEYRAWSLAILGRAEHGLGNEVAARQHLLEALEIVVEIRAFIPLLHLVPVIPRLLVDAEDTRLIERAVEIYAMTETHPFIAAAQLFEDIAGHAVKTKAAEALAPEVAEAAQTRGRALDWWETAEALLGELRELGWGEDRSKGPEAAIDAESSADTPEAH
jgi:tetratricopeptide (TPR) repeat protein